MPLALGRWVWIGLLQTALVMSSAIAHADPTPAADRAGACPSLLGTWYGSFEGSAVGSWSAVFDEAPGGFAATATIVVSGIGPVDGAGTAVVRCENGVATLSGEGKAGNRKCFFDGVAHRDGRYLVGTWSSGSLAGTWNGER